MITDFNQLRKSIEPPERQRGLPIREQINGERTYGARIQYVQAMALIQIAQDLHEIKIALYEGKIRFEGKINE